MKLEVKVHVVVEDVEIFFRFFKSTLPFLNNIQLDVYLGHFGGFQYYFSSKNVNLELEIGIQGLLLKLQNSIECFLK